MSPPRMLRHTHLCPCGVLGVLVVLGFPRGGLADDSNYQNFVIGGRAMGLGGAFTSLSDDPSGLFYNPAGIADVEDTSYQVSTSLYGFERGSYDTDSVTLPVAGLEDLQLEFTDLIIVPASAGFVKTLGEPGPNGLPVHAYAISVIVPPFMSFNAGSSGGTEDSEGLDGILRRSPPSYSRRVTDRSLWAGAGYARRLGSRLRLGISGYYILRSTVDIEEVSMVATIDDGDANPANDSQVFRTARNDIRLLNGSVRLILGAKYRLTDQINLGLSFQTPSIELHSQSTLRFSSGDSVPDCGQLGLPPERLAACQAEPLLQEPRSNYVNRTIEGRSGTRYAPSLRAGGSFVLEGRLTLSADLVYHFPVSYNLISDAPLDRDTLARMPFNPRIQRRGVLNFNAGGEFLIVREVSVSAGVFSDFSSAPQIPDEPLRDQPARVNLFGATMALGYFGEHTLSRVGFQYSFGRGRDVIPTSDIGRILERRQAFESVDYLQSFFYVFLSSTFRY